MYREEILIPQYIYTNNVHKISQISKQCIESTIFEIQTQKSSLPTKYLGLLHIAAFYGSLEAFVYLHRTLNLNINMRTPLNYTPLHYACASNSFEIASYIVSLDPNSVKIVTGVKESFLFLAVENNATEIVKLLCEKGACIETTSHNEFSPLNMAARKGNVEMLVQMLKYAVSSKNEIDQAPMINAVKFGRVNLVKALISNGYQPDVSCSWQFPLHIALSNHHVDLEMIKTIVENSEVLDIQSGKRRLWTVHYICSSMSSRAASIIMKSGHINVNNIDIDERPGPYYLQQTNPTEAVNILNILYKKGFEPCCYINRKPLVLCYLDHLGDFSQIIAWFLNHGVSLDQVYNGKTIREHLKYYKNSLISLGVSW